MTDSRLLEITARIEARSTASRTRYLRKIEAMRCLGVQRAHLSCGNQAHAFAASKQDKEVLSDGQNANIGIVTAYNDMLSAHQPYAVFPELIKAAARATGATAQVAAGVPAMCDGVTQGQAGMGLSLFSRDLIAMSASIGLCHNVFDAALFLGVCDKIVPGLIIAAARFGHLPAIFVPAGPMPSGLGNDKKTEIRHQFATGKVGRTALMRAEMASYHSPGTCTFYGTANTNQMLMEFMGLHLAGASFVPPGSGLREALTRRAVSRVLGMTALGDNYLPSAEILSAQAYVNAIVGLMATGGSTNLLIHLPAMARASGILLASEDFEDISAIVPLITKIYPNGLADINHFNAAGGVGLIIYELLENGLLHREVQTVMGGGLTAYCCEPKYKDKKLEWVDGAKKSENEKIITSLKKPFQKTGGLKVLKGNLGNAVIKTSALAQQNLNLVAPARVFNDQATFIAAAKEGEFTQDVIIVLRGQGPKANGMPELHGLTPTLMGLQEKGLRVALVTDGRMSGASGKVPAAVHLTPEAAEGGPIARLRDGDILHIDAEAGTLAAKDVAVLQRAPTRIHSKNDGVGRELFSIFRACVGNLAGGATIFDFEGDASDDA